MKAISIRQPWASLIIDGHKDIENREWSTRLRGWVAIHAAKGCTKDEWEDADFFCVLRGLPQPRPLAELPRGGFIGFAWLGDCITGSQSPWFVGTYGHVFSKPHSRSFVPYKGQLGYFDVSDSFLQEHWGQKEQPASPKVLNRHHLPNKGYPLPPNAVYVGRGTPWGNPYYHPRDPDPIEQFGCYVFDDPDLIKRIQQELRGRDLVCSCAPRACHADILLEIANAETDNIDELARICRLMASF